MLQKKENYDNYLVQCTLRKVSEYVLDGEVFQFLFYPICKKQFQAEDGTLYDCMFEDIGGNIRYFNTSGKTLNVPDSGYVTYYHDDRDDIEASTKIYSHYMGE